MSRARSVPAFIVANSAPWMNGTASAKATNEFVGKPGRLRLRLQAAGVDGEQQQREDERRDHVRRLAERAHDRAARRAGRPGRRASSQAGSMRQPAARPPFFALVVVGALERAAGLGEEDVVERRLVQLELLDLEVLARRARARSRPGRPRPSRSRTATPCDRAARARRSARGSRPARSRPAGSAGIASTVGRPTSAFSSSGRALGDDLAVVDDPDAVGEDVRLLEVLGRQEDGDARPRARAGRPPPRARSGSGCRGRSSARRGRGCAGGGRAPARGRAGASSRPSSP